MYHVLVPVDEDGDRLERQLETFRSLPGRSELSATVLYVHENIDSPPDEAGESVIESINENIESLQGVPETFGRAATELEELGVRVDTVETSGDAAPKILEVAEEIEADAILMAGREMTSIGKAIFGSVTQGVLLDSDRPVIVAK